MFGDEFDGAELDASKWSRARHGEAFCWNGAKGLRCDDHAAVDGQGHFVVRVTRDADGSSRVNLIEALENDASRNSRDVLWPVLSEGAFSQLEILCAHVPRWFAGALEELGLEARYRTVREGVAAVVSRKT